MFLLFFKNFLSCKVEEEVEIDDLELSRPYEPVIACLSPTLARLANSRSVWVKTTTAAAATSPLGASFDAIARKRKAEEQDPAMVHKSPKSPKRQSDVERLRNRDFIRCFQNEL